MSFQPIIDALDGMKNSRLRNYIAPGLTSYLVGGEHHGKVRLFAAERTTLEFITPHSHRFDFTCLVLQGIVYNSIFYPGTAEHELWCMSTINQVCGGDGLLDYVHTREASPGHWYSKTDRWVQGQIYSMTHDQIHSIKFERGTKVLFFEGPQVTKTGRMLEPWVGGRCVPTFKTESWMFRRDDEC